MNYKKVYSQYIKVIISVIVCSYPLSSLAQDKFPGSPELPRFALRANIGIPKIVSSEQYRNSFSGVITGEIGITCKLVSNYFFGVGYSYNYFKAQRYFRENTDPRINASMQMHGGYLKLGYDHFFKENAFTTISFNMGYQSGKYYGLQYPVRDTVRSGHITDFGNAYVEPMIGVYFIVDPNFAFGAHLSYSYNFQQFNASNIGFDKFGFAKSPDKPRAYNDLHNKWGMSMITLGFGFYYGLVRKR